MDGNEPCSPRSPEADSEDVSCFTADFEDRSWLDSLPEVERNIGMTLSCVTPALQTGQVV